MTDAWKRRVDERLIEIGQNRQWLARQLKTGKSSVTQMLSAKQTASVFVDAVCRILAINPPAVGVPAGEIEEILSLLQEMTPDERQHWLAVMRGMRRG